MEQPIVGHQQIITQLHHAFRSNRIAGAYLFVGPGWRGQRKRLRFISQNLSIVSNSVKVHAETAFPAERPMSEITPTHKSLALGSLDKN